MFTRFTSLVGAATLGVVGAIALSIAAKQTSFELKTKNTTRRWGKIDTDVQP